MHGKSVKPIPDRMRSVIPHLICAGAAHAIEFYEQAFGANSKDANAHYLYALALGRYGQGISVAAALKQGLGGKIKASLEEQGAKVEVK